MCDIIFADLDGTLIFSASRKLPGDIVCEYKDGAEISCITQKQSARLQGMRIIPVTTRSIEQYRRINIPEFQPEYALTDNGGTLLINGTPDPQWTERSLALAAECSAQLAECRRIMERDINRNFEIRLVDGMFLFTKSTQPESSLAALRQAAGDSIICYHTGQKLYALPAKLCKGASAKRLAERISGGSRIICAGDSLMDVPLLNIADIAIFPEDMPQENITAKQKITAPRSRFPEFVTEYFTRIKDIQ